MNVAAALGEQGQRVLLLDLDHQASTSSWLGCTNGDRGFLDVFTDNVHLTDLPHRTNVPNVDIVPASTWLVDVDKAVGVRFCRLPTDARVLSIAALVACQAILVPVETRVMALGGLAAHDLPALAAFP